MKLTILATLAVGALLLLPFAPEAQPCVAVDFTLHAYSGQIVVSDACLVSATHSGDRLVIEARDVGDFLFHGDFEVWP